jgi:hypothetical protein
MSKFLSNTTCWELTDEARVSRALHGVVWKHMSTQHNTIFYCVPARHPHSSSDASSKIYHSAFFVWKHTERNAPEVNMHVANWIPLRIHDTRLTFIFLQKTRPITVAAPSSVTPTQGSRVRITLGAWIYEGRGSGPLLCRGKRWLLCQVVVVGVT